MGCEPDFGTVILQVLVDAPAPNVPKGFAFWGDPNPLKGSIVGFLILKFPKSTFCVKLNLGLSSICSAAAPAAPAAPPPPPAAVPTATAPSAAVGVVV